MEIDQALDSLSFLALRNIVGVGDESIGKLNGEDEGKIILLAFKPTINRSLYPNRIHIEKGWSFYFLRVLFFPPENNTDNVLFFLNKLLLISHCNVA